MKRILNRLLLPFSRYHAYAGDVPGWAGYYRFMGRCTGFRGSSGETVTAW